MSWDSKAKYRIYRIHEEVEDWDRAVRKGWSYTARSSRRALGKWIAKAKSHLHERGATGDLLAALEKMIFFGELAYNKDEHVSTIMGMFRDPPKMAEYYADYAQQMEIDQQRAGDQFKTFQGANRNLTTLITAATNAKRFGHREQYQRGRNVYNYMNTPEVVVIADGLSPIPGATDEEWADWKENVERARSILADWEHNPVRQAQLQRAHLDAMAARAAEQQTPTALDPGVTLENAIVAYRMSASSSNVIELQRALVRARVVSSLDELVAEGDSLLSFGPSVPATLELEPEQSFISEHPVLVTGAALLTVAGVAWLVSRLGR